MVKPIISTLDAESGASSQSGLGRRLPIRSQLVEVSLTLNGDPSKCLNAGVGDATPLEGDEKLPNMTSLQLLKIQESSHEQDARNCLFSHVQSEQATLLSICEAELKEVSNREWSNKSEDNF